MNYCICCRQGHKNVVAKPGGRWCRQCQIDGCPMPKLEEPITGFEAAAKAGNAVAADLCTTLLQKTGPHSLDYTCAIGAAATTLLFHAWQIGLHADRKQAIMILKSILDDVTTNAKSSTGAVPPPEFTIR
ncbi:MAG: hypothetical protein A3E01_10280 [Gammaproteobacteria bacterium RIFCSPHIGHO2_12_FULL_63_22]|nr:MAG: hypothetical protein A3E01_10280 [Gammaproteobacteria bacterium RIFCSPHIGHO2_12_FULL_63_22]